MLVAGRGGPRPWTSSALFVLCGFPSLRRYAWSAVVRSDFPYCGHGSQPINLFGVSSPWCTYRCVGRHTMMVAAHEVRVVALSLQPGCPQISPPPGPLPRLLCSLALLFVWPRVCSPRVPLNSARHGGCERKNIFFSGRPCPWAGCLFCLQVYCCTPSPSSQR